MEKERKEEAAVLNASFTETVAPQSIEMIHQSSLKWITWRMVTPKFGDKNYNTLTVYTPVKEITATTVSINLTVFGVNSPETGQWLLSANRKSDGQWIGKITATTAHPKTGFELTCRNCTTDSGYTALEFTIILPENRDYYQNGLPFYTAQIASDQLVYCNQGRVTFT